MCCTPNRPHLGRHVAYGCCMPSGHMPFMWSKRKMISALENYLDDLKEEIKDIEEQLTELKKEK